ncbi:MAG: hypothetical protein K8L99_22575, partial [Anaerolineae bacterium]|nr:hypothetical protein [Anaerolineae bacterium]
MRLTFTRFIDRILNINIYQGRVAQDQARVIYSITAILFVATSVFFLSVGSEVRYTLLPGAQILLIVYSLMLATILFTRFGFLRWGALSMILMWTMIAVAPVVQSGMY